MQVDVLVAVDGPDVHLVARVVGLADEPRVAPHQPDVRARHAHRHRQCPLAATGRRAGAAAAPWAVRVPAAWTRRRLAEAKLITRTGLSSRVEQPGPGQLGAAAPPPAGRRTSSGTSSRSPAPPGRGAAETSAEQPFRGSGRRHRRGQAPLPPPAKPRYGQEPRRRRTLKSSRSRSASAMPATAPRPSEVRSDACGRARRRARRRGSCARRTPARPRPPRWHAGRRPGCAPAPRSDAPR